MVGAIALGLVLAQASSPFAGVWKGVVHLKDLPDRACELTITKSGYVSARIGEGEHMWGDHLSAKGDDNLEPFSNPYSRFGKAKLVDKTHLQITYAEADTGYRSEMSSVLTLAGPVPRPSKFVGTWAGKIGRMACRLDVDELGNFDASIPRGAMTLGSIDADGNVEKWSLVDPFGTVNVSQLKLIDAKHIRVTLLRHKEGSMSGARESTGVLKWVRPGR